MARKLDATQLRELQGFVAALKELGGYSTSAEWARDSGFPAPNLSKLETGVGGVDGYNLLRLIRAAARRAELTPAETAAAAAVSRRPGAAAMQELVAQAAEEVSVVLERLLVAAASQAPRQDAARESRRR